MGPVIAGLLFVIGIPFLLSWMTTDTEYNNRDYSEAVKRYKYKQKYD